MAKPQHPLHGAGGGGDVAQLQCGDERGCSPTRGLRLWQGEGGYIHDCAPVPSARPCHTLLHEREVHCAVGAAQGPCQCPPCFPAPICKCQGLWAAWQGCTCARGKGLARPDCLVGQPLHPLHLSAMEAQHQQLQRLHCEAPVVGRGWEAPGG